MPTGVPTRTSFYGAGDERYAYSYERSDCGELDALVQATTGRPLDPKAFWGEYSLSEFTVPWPAACAGPDGS